MIRALRQRAGRKQLPAVEAEVRSELRRIRSRMFQLTGALATSADGTVLAEDSPGVAAEEAAAQTAEVLAAVLRLADVTSRGTPRELVVRGGSGYLATYAAGRSTVLTLLAEDGVNLGRLHLEGRRCAARIGELVDGGTAGPPALDPAPLSPPAPPTTPPAAPATAAVAAPGAVGATAAPASAPNRTLPHRTSGANAPTTHS
ncbi:roadblock/LC7 domain-containing protein [Streptomyces sp. NPDC002734]|uniref:roadblock/LC7 domain-containing protein n=1 Tax=Streptomyces sp. NPDC002734 TaxID=3154426 RepID=UPI00332E09B3